MSWRLKLADLISGGLVTEYQRQAKLAKAKLEQIKINVDNLQKQLQYSQREREQAQAQLLMAKGFHTELGETQLQLKKTARELLQCQQQLKQQQAIKPMATGGVNEGEWYQKLQRTITVTEVKRLPLKDFDALWGFRIASPQTETKVQGGAIIFQGWVLGKKAAATKIRINYQDRTLVEAPINCLLLELPNIIQILQQQRKWI